MQQTSAAIHGQQTLVSGSACGNATAQFTLILSSEHEGVCSAAEQEGSQRAANAPGIENVGVNRTKGHEIRCGLVGEQ